MKKAGWLVTAFAAAAIGGTMISANANKDVLLKAAVHRNDGVTAALALRVFGANPNANEGFLLGETLYNHNTFMAKQFVAAGYNLNNRGACPTLDSALVVDHDIAGFLLDAGFKPTTPNCNVLPRIADGWFNSDHGIMDNSMLRKVLEKGHFSEAQLDDAMAGAATFNRDPMALYVLQEAGGPNLRDKRVYGHLRYSSGGEGSGDPGVRLASRTSAWDCCAAERCPPGAVRPMAPGLRSHPSVSQA